MHWKIATLMNSSITSFISQANRSLKRAKMNYTTPMNCLHCLTKNSIHFIRCKDIWAKHTWDQKRLLIIPAWVALLNVLSVQLFPYTMQDGGVNRHSLFTKTLNT